MKIYPVSPDLLKLRAEILTAHKEFFKHLDAIVGAEPVCDISDAGLRKWRDEAIAGIRFEVGYLKVKDALAELGMIKYRFPNFEDPW